MTTRQTKQFPCQTHNCSILNSNYYLRSFKFTIASTKQSVLTVFFPTNGFVAHCGRLQVSAGTHLPPRVPPHGPHPHPRLRHLRDPLLLLPSPPPNPNHPNEMTTRQTKQFPCQTHNCSILNSNYYLRSFKFTIASTKQSVLTVFFPTNGFVAHCGRLQVSAGTM